jgi:rubrerythrin
MSSQLFLFSDYKPPEWFLNEEMTHLNMFTILKQLYPELRLFKEFNPLEEIWVDKTYCISCDKEKKFPTMYFVEEAYGCYNCGHRGTSINFFKENKYSTKEIADFIMRKKKLSLENHSIESLIEKIDTAVSEDIHHIFENEKFFPGTACLHIGDYGNTLKAYRKIRERIWKEYFRRKKLFNNNTSPDSVF